MLFEEFFGEARSLVAKVYEDPMELGTLYELVEVEIGKQFEREEALRHRRLLYNYMRGHGLDFEFMFAFSQIKSRTQSLKHAPVMAQGTHFALIREIQGFRKDLSEKQDRLIGRFLERALLVYGEGWQLCLGQVGDFDYLPVRMSNICFSSKKARCYPHLTHRTEHRGSVLPLTQYPDMQQGFVDAYGASMYNTPKKLANLPEFQLASARAVDYQLIADYRRFYLQARDSDT